MQSELLRLVERLKQVTAQRGKKAELARFLCVPQARVSEWLSRKKEPGGETTLKLLSWVESRGRALIEPHSGVRTRPKTKRAVRERKPGNRKLMAAK